VTLDYGTLFVVPTPIGNRDDLSPRARQILCDVDLIAAEDTRHTGRLLSHFGIKTPQIALHEHNEERLAGQLVERLRQGASIALVSDAGTPLISDPGYRLVDAAHAAGVRLSPLPGASAVMTAMSVAGLPTDRFCFEGFLPARRLARRASIDGLIAERRTMVFFQSVHKIVSTLADMADRFGCDRPAFIGRELTKLHEQCVRATLGEIGAMLEDGRIPAKGEFVVVVAGASAGGDEAGESWIRPLLAELVAAMPGSQAVDIVARVAGKGRNDVYRLMLELKDSDPAG
jgi:16S rRNA (cytidine1402-2'-O)-methyltransferase